MTNSKLLQRLLRVTFRLLVIGGVLEGIKIVVLIIAETGPPR